MLFNSYDFLFLFLPLALTGLYLLALNGHLRMAVWWTGLASVAFYAISSLSFTWLLLGSVLANYTIGLRIVDAANSPAHAAARKLWLAAGVTANLAVLCYFKYQNFFIGEIAPGWSASFGHVALPAGISFYTFTQIGFLVDAGRGHASRYRFADYLLFVTFFPHLIAGPILNHKKIVPQLESRDFGRPDAATVYAAFMFFSIGLFKKVVIADSLAPLVQPLFLADARLGFFEAWGAALLYAFQLYYDFSGYSEMAVGLALLMNVRIPINFDSPYKATSIIDFWRRWHISLSEFLRDYLYIPLGGNRHGTPRRYLNLLATMILGGLWHGAGWTFLAWGALHGVCLAINHAWRATGLRLVKPLAWLLTTIVVLVAWVFFRAPDMPTALRILKAMANWRELVSLDKLVLTPTVFIPDPATTLAWIAALGIWVLVAPNTQQLALAPRPRLSLAFACAVMMAGAVMAFDRATEYLYFRF